MGNGPARGCRPRLPSVCCGFAVLLLATNSLAVEPKTSLSVRAVADNKPGKSPGDAKRGDDISPSSRKASPKSWADDRTEATVLELVRTHLPELRAVLDRLRAKEPAQYRQAVADLAKSARKLEVAKNRDERLYEIELQILKAQTTRDLLTAKLKVRDSKSDRKSLLKAIERFQEAQLARSEYDVDSLRARLARTEQLYERAQQRLAAKQSERNKQLEKSYLAALRQAGRKAEPAPRKRPAPATPSGSPKSKPLPQQEK